jgi:hypothetical protein
MFDYALKSLNRNKQAAKYHNKKMEVQLTMKNIILVVD